MPSPKHYKTPDGHWKSERNLALQHRALMHDYQSWGVYMITLTTNNRKPLFGTLDIASATIHPSDLGNLISQEWNAIPSHVPQIKTLDFQLMPDHLHGLLRVTAHLDKPTLANDGDLDHQRENIAKAQMVFLPQETVFLLTNELTKH